MSDPDLTLLERLAYGNRPATALRLSQRPAVLWAAEIAYQTLLFPDEAATLSVAERHAVAAFCAHLHLETSVQSHYRGLLRLTLRDQLAQTAVIEAEALYFRDSPVPNAALRGEARAALGAKLSDILTFAGQLTLDPVADRGAPDVVSQDDLNLVSRIVALVTFQARLIAGFRDLADPQHIQDGAAA